MKTDKPRFDHRGVYARPFCWITCHDWRQETGVPPRDASAFCRRCLKTANVTEVMQ